MATREAQVHLDEVRELGEAHAESSTEGGQGPHSCGLRDVPAADALAEGLGTVT